MPRFFSSFSQPCCSTFCTFFLSVTGLPLPLDWALNCELIVGSISIFFLSSIETLSGMWCISSCFLVGVFSILTLRIKFYLVYSCTELTYTCSLELTIYLLDVMVQCWVCLLHRLSVFRAGLQSHSSLYPPENLGQCLVSSHKCLHWVDSYAPEGLCYIYIRPLFPLICLLPRVCLHLT